MEKIGGFIFVSLLGISYLPVTSAFAENDVIYGEYVPKNNEASEIILKEGGRICGPFIFRGTGYDPVIEIPAGQCVGPAMTDIPEAVRKANRPR